MKCEWSGIPPLHPLKHYAVIDKCYMYTRYPQYCIFIVRTKKKEQNIVFDNFPDRS